MIPIPNDSEGDRWLVPIPVNGLSHLPGPDPESIYEQSLTDWLRH